MKRLTFTLCTVLLTACGHNPPQVIIEYVNIPVPVECKEPVPTRPVMPTESLSPGVDLDTFSKSVMAEIERRDGYETELLTALENCRKPI